MQGLPHKVNPPSVLKMHVGTMQANTITTLKKINLGSNVITPPIAGSVKSNNPEQYLKLHIKGGEAAASGSDQHPGLKDLQEEHTNYQKAKSIPIGLAPHNNNAYLQAIWILDLHSAVQDGPPFVAL